MNIIHSQSSRDTTLFFYGIIYMIGCDFMLKEKN